jgi:Ala-tRNA(Pro) deacylase
MQVPGLEPSTARVDPRQHFVNFCLLFLTFGSMDLPGLTILVNQKPPNLPHYPLTFPRHSILQAEDTSCFWGQHLMYVLDFLRSHGVWFEPLLHRPASSSAKRARSVHVPGRRVAKTVLIKSGDTFMLLVLSSTSRIDLCRLSEVVGAPPAQVRLATTNELFELFPDCEPGVVPAFGRLYGLTTLVDSELTDCPEIIVGANTRHEGLRMLFRDFQRLEEPIHASFTCPLAPEPARSSSARTDENRRAS